jgi:hypothetical protein
MCYHVVRELPDRTVAETLGVTPEFQEAKGCALFWLDYYDSQGLKTDGSGTVADENDFFLFQIRILKMH